MKYRRAISIITPLSFFALALVVLMLPKFTHADWLKIGTPPDVDKKAHNYQNNRTCWLSDDAGMQ
jgi:hypothetical protein